MKAIRALKARKASGDDQIPNELLKEGGEELTRALVEVFNDMIEEEWTPREWAEERVTMLHKGGDKKDLNNYRGIAIGSNVGKVFARIINSRIYEMAEEQGWLGEMQAGFRKDRSTKDNIFLLGHLAEKAQQRGERLFVIFIDFQKAYDRVWRDGLWECLEERGLDRKTISIIQSLYNGHRRRIQTAWGLTDWVDCNRGLKQGCVLSPLLFALFIAELEERLVEGGEGPTCGDTVIPGLFFADDLGVLAVGEEGVNKQLQITMDFVQERRLNINQKKSAIMEIGAKKGRALQGGWHVDEDTRIPTTDLYKYLGMWQNRKGRFEAHFKEKEKGVKKKVAVATMLARGSGKMTEGIQKLWEGVVRPALLYGTEVVAVPKKWIKTVEGAQLEMGRQALGATKDAAKAGIRGEMGWTSIQGLVDKGKCAFVEQVRRMEDSRWPKKMLGELERGEINSRWWEETKAARQRLNMDDIRNTDVPWKGRLRSNFWRREEATWREEVEKRASLVLYPKTDLKGAAQTGREQDRKVMARARIGNLVPFAMRQKLKKCPWCEEEPTNWNTHILFECKGSLEHPLEPTQERQQPQGLTEDQRRQVLGDLSSDNIRRIARRVEKWMEKVND